MIMWLIILIVVMLLTILGICYLISRIGKFEVIKRLGRNQKRYIRLVSTLVIFLASLIIWLTLGYVNLCVVLISVTFIYLLTELVFLLLSKVKILGLNEKMAGSNLNWSGICAISLSAIYLLTGAYLAHHVFWTNYTVYTEKAVEPLKIIMLSDSHISTTLDGDDFAKEMARISEAKPDIVIIAGDYVDGSSKYEDVEKATQSLSTIDSKYGVFFSFGNHDKNYYGEDARRGFNTEKLVELLEENNVTILEDQFANIEGGYTVLGRMDKSDSARAAIKSLRAEIPSENYVIDINHQPNDYVAEAEAGVDLVLSGHTHGGQLFPINEVGVLIGANDKTYGYERRNNTDFIVSSGIGDWAIDFKTGCKAEIVEINVVPGK